MKKLSFIFTVLFCIFMASCCSTKKTSEAPAERTDEVTVATQSTDNQLTTRNMENLTKVLFKTSEGDIIIALYDNTPKHKENYSPL